MLVADAGHPELAATAGLAARIEVRIEELLGPVNGAPEEGRSDDARQRGLVGHPMVMAAPVDQVCGPGGPHIRVIEALEDGLDLRGQMLRVHPVDGVCQRAQHAELAAGREARAVFDVAGLVAVVPVHARDPMLVRAHAGRDRGGTNRRDRRERGDAVRHVGPTLADLLQGRGASERDGALEHGRFEGVDDHQHELFWGARSHRRMRSPAYFLSFCRLPATSIQQSARRPTMPTGGATTDRIANNTAIVSAYIVTAEAAWRSRRARARANSGLIAARPTSAQAMPARNPGQSVDQWGW